MNLSLESLTVYDYRNYAGSRRFDFGENSRLICIVGDNARGKSNLLEAIQTISYGYQQKNEQDKINKTANQLHINAQYKLYQKSYNLQYQYSLSNHIRNISLNKVSYKSLRDCAEYIPRSVIFRAEDSLKIAYGSAQYRRDWMDLLLSLTYPDYLFALRSYNQALQHRNKLLKNSSADLMEIWEYELAKYMLTIMQYRYELVQAAENPINNYYRALSPNHQDEYISMEYLPSIRDSELSIEYLAMQLASARQIDLHRGYTTIGIHRDDLALSINHLLVRDYASQGQKRAYILSLLLFQADMWNNHYGYAPMILLDDICAELDPERQEALFAHLPTQSQIFLTTTHIYIQHSDLLILDLNSI